MSPPGGSWTPRRCSGAYGRFDRTPSSLHRYRSQDHVAREQQWWLENRNYQDLFTVELEEAVALVARLPGAGTLYSNAGIVGLRRLYLQMIGCHLYYTHDDHQVIVRALWGARRERGPLL